MSYNLKILKFKDDSYQIRTYMNPIKESDEEIFNEPDKSGFEASPFGDVLKDITPNEREPDFERSLSVSYNRTKNKIYEIARSNDWEYFVTLTFDPKIIDSTDYDLVSKYMSEWLHSIKKRYCPFLKYIIVPELHSDGKKFHFHALFADCDGLPLTYSGHKIKGKEIYNIDCYHKGFTSASKVEDSKKVSSYILKYITKDLCCLTKGKKRYWASRNCILPIVTKLSVPADEIKGFLENNLDNIQYSKTVECSVAYQSIGYFEANKINF